MSMQGQQPVEVPFSEVKVGQKYRVRYEVAGTYIDLTGTVSMKEDGQLMIILANAGGKLRGDKIKFFKSV
ncbi:MAG TPA: hypothetical protein V6C81_25140 [Planktothrix sp.]